MSAHIHYAFPQWTSKDDVYADSPSRVVLNEGFSAVTKVLTGIKMNVPDA